jgi:excisionase family DNA binding protein
MNILPSTYQQLNDSKDQLPETMTATQVARFLGVDRKTVYGYANRGRIPCRKLGKRLLFSRTHLMAWLRGESVLPQQGI